jgi:hypothetical protein
MSLLVAPFVEAERPFVRQALTTTRWVKESIEAALVGHGDSVTVVKTSANPPADPELVEVTTVDGRTKVRFLRYSAGPGCSVCGRAPHRSRERASQPECTNPKSPRSDQSLPL